MLPLLLLIEAVTADPPKPGPVEHLRKVVVAAIRNCPDPVPGEVTVCARDRGVAEGYRLPRLDSRYAGAALRPSGRGTLAGADLGASGTGSCSTIGASGATGCSLAEINAWSAWRRQQRSDAQVDEMPH